MDAATSDMRFKWCTILDLCKVWTWKNVHFLLLLKFSKEVNANLLDLIYLKPRLDRFNQILPVYWNHKSVRAIIQQLDVIQLLDVHLIVGCSYIPMPKVAIRGPEISESLDGVSVSTSFAQSRLVSVLTSIETQKFSVSVSMIKIWSR